MSEYQLGLIAPQRIEALRIEAETDRRAQALRRSRRSGQVDATRLIAIVRVLARRLVPAA